MSELKVDLVAADRKVWSGQATMVRARSIDGDLGIMGGHTPLLAVLAEGEVKIEAADGSVQTVMVDSGFLSVDHNRVTIVADSVGVAPKG